MEARIIASFRAIGGPGRPFLERARSLVERLTSLGGVHVGWDVLKITFAFEASKLPAVLDAAINPGPETQGEEPPWAVGLAQGDIRPVNEPGSPLTSSGLLWWGPPIVAASALAGLARPGEILCAQTIPALRAGDLVTSGLRIAREGTLRVRGARIFTPQPWKRQAAENLTRMKEPRLVTAHLPAVSLEPGALVVLRADPGAGGTRLLNELAARAPRALVISPAGSGFEPLGALRRALGCAAGRVVNPLLLELQGPLDALLAGKGVSLDMAARLITAFLWPKVSGTNSALIVDDAKWVDPATLEACVRAVRKAPAFGIIARLDKTGGLPCVLAGLNKAAEHELPALSREGAEDVAVGCTGGALDALARGRWARLGGGSPLAVVEAITHGIASGDIVWSGDHATPRSRAAGRGKVRSAAKWIRKRANAEKTPVRVMLSVLAVVGGEARVSTLERILEKASLRVDAPATLAYMERTRWVVVPREGWVAFPSRTHKDALFATLEDEVKQKLHLAAARTIEETEGAFGRVEGAWHAAQAGEGAKAAAVLLEAARATGEARFETSTTQLVAFARRADPSCEEAALEILSQVLERPPSANPPFASMPPTAVPSAPPVGFGPPPATPHSFFGPRPSNPPPRTGPERVAAIASVPPVPRSVSVPPPAPPRVPIPPATVPQIPDDFDDMVEHALFSGEEPDSMVEHAVIINPDSPPQAAGAATPGDPPTVMSEGVLPMDEPEPACSGPPTSGSQPPPSGGNTLAHRLAELARDALHAADNAALERWADGLEMTSESVAFTERMRAMEQLGRGDIGDALRALRKTLSQLDPNDHRRRCQTALALGVALSVAGRPQEALLEGLDALARARQVDDERGAKACLAFLAKLYSSVSRDEDADRLRARSMWRR